MSPLLLSADFYAFARGDGTGRPPIFMTGEEYSKSPDGKDWIVPRGRIKEGLGLHTRKSGFLRPGGETRAGHEHQYGCIVAMKRRDLEKRLRESGWRFLRHGGSHDIWTNGAREEAIPRHREISERLALVILSRVRERTER